MSITVYIGGSILAALFGIFTLGCAMHEQKKKDEKPNTLVTIVLLIGGCFFLFLAGEGLHRSGYGHATPIHDLSTTSSYTVVWADQYNSVLRENETGDELFVDGIMWGISEGEIVRLCHGDKLCADD